MIQAKYTAGKKVYLVSYDEGLVAVYTKEGNRHQSIEFLSQSDVLKLESLPDDACVVIAHAGVPDYVRVGLSRLRPGSQAILVFESSVDNVNRWVLNSIDPGLVVRSTSKPVKPTVWRAHPIELSPNGGHTWERSRLTHFGGCYYFATMTNNEFVLINANYAATAEEEIRRLAHGIQRTLGRTCSLREILDYYREHRSKAVARLQKLQKTA